MPCPKSKTEFKCNVRFHYFKSIIDFITRILYTKKIFEKVVLLVKNNCMQEKLGNLIFQKWEKKSIESQFLTICAIKRMPRLNNSRRQEIFRTQRARERVESDARKPPEMSEESCRQRRSCAIGSEGGSSKVVVGQLRLGSIQWRRTWHRLSYEINCFR